MAKITAKIRTSWIQDGDTGVMVHFIPDYADERNQEWAMATPTLNLSMLVKDRNLFKQGQSYTLTFEENNA